MRISDWSSDVCSSDLVPEESTRRSTWKSFSDMGSSSTLEITRCWLSASDEPSPLTGGAIEVRINIRPSVKPPLFSRLRCCISEILDRKSVGWGKSVSVRVYRGGWQ